MDSGNVGSDYTKLDILAFIIHIEIRGNNFTYWYIIRGLIIQHPGNLIEMISRDQKLTSCYEQARWMVA